MLNKDKSRHIFTWRYDEVTILHWGINFVKADTKGPSGTTRGYLSAQDKKVLSLDVRVEWQLPAKAKATAGRKRAKPSASFSSDSESAPLSPSPSSPPKKRRGRPRKN